MYENSLASNPTHIVQLPEEEIFLSVEVLENQYANTQVFIIHPNRTSFRLVKGQITQFPIGHGRELVDYQLYLKIFVQNNNLLSDRAYVIIRLTNKKGRLVHKQRCKEQFSDPFKKVKFSVFLDFTI